MGHKYRLVNTKIWDDDYIDMLDDAHKVLYMYLIINPNSNLLGVFELSIRKMEYHTRKSPEELRKMLDKFINDGKITYNNGYLHLKNFLKNQPYNGTMKVGAIKEYNSLPSGIKELHLQELCHKNWSQSFIRLMDGFNIIEKKDQPQTSKLSVKTESKPQKSEKKKKTPKKESPKKTKDKIDFKSFKYYWNENCGEVKQIRSLTENRKKKLDSLLKQFSKDELKLSIEKMRDSSFLQGKVKSEGHPNWMCTLDWYLIPGNFVKILEGNYDNDKLNGNVDVFASKTNVQAPLPAKYALVEEGDDE